MHNMCYGRYLHGSIHCTLTFDYFSPSREDGLFQGYTDSLVGTFAESRQVAYRN